MPTKNTIRRHYLIIRRILRNDYPSKHILLEFMKQYDVEVGERTFQRDLAEIVSPIYLFFSKFDRYINTANIQRRKTDFYDLRTLLSIVEKTNGLDELESHLSNRNYDQRAEDMLNNIIASML